MTVQYDNNVKDYNGDLNGSWRAEIIRFFVYINNCLKIIILKFVIDRIFGMHFAQKCKKLPELFAIDYVKLSTIDRFGI